MTEPRPKRARKPSPSIRRSGKGSRPEHGLSHQSRPTGWTGIKPLTLSVLLTATACATPPLPACPPPAATPIAWVVDYGWHTELIVPAQQLAPPLTLFRTMFPAARTLSFGFGKQSFMTLAHPGFGDLLAGAIPGPATVRVIPLPADPGEIYTERVTRIPLTPPEWTALAAFLWRSFARTTRGALVPIAAEDPSGHFFAATPGYSLAYTCNAWTIDALHQSVLSVGGLVIRSGAAMREVATITGACADPR